MAMEQSTTASAFLPEAYGNLVDLAVKAQSIAARSATVVSTDKVSINFPKWVSDPAVGWYEELDAISYTDGSTAEVKVTPTKTAGLTRIGRETAEDSDPGVMDLVGSGLANQIARSIDAAYLGNTTAKGPNGLLSIASTSVDTGTALANTDPFIAARFAAKSKGSELTSWLVSPETAEVLSKIKKQSTGSNENLIEFVEDGIRVAGLPVLISDQMTADTATVFWGIPQKHVVLVMRRGTTVERARVIGNDAYDVLATSRLGIGFLNPAGVVRGYDVA